MDGLIGGTALRQGGRRPERAGAHNSGGVREAPRTADAAIRDGLVDSGDASDGDATGIDSGDDGESGLLDRMSEYRASLGLGSFPAMLHM